MLLHKYCCFLKIAGTSCGSSGGEALLKGADSDLQGSGGEAEGRSQKGATYWEGGL